MADRLRTSLGTGVATVEGVVGVIGENGDRGDESEWRLARRGVGRSGLGTWEDTQLERSPSAVVSEQARMAAVPLTLNRGTPNL